ncbi:LysE/ArgO family amino acid transporter [Pseudoruegeria sp. SK021]|uniref:LysE/ArgO family amino acid transporter n=1 Tax=Pseudoruegeria sp. SK021 TaxID=1933035 RepID=UPI000A241024|nr:LysE/ArgO family amino acid transporter [Pseudoruegeria sp. SK021]OSP55471.1 amino acid transporter [Pseudoruegeria sp. SK021]
MNAALVTGFATGLSLILAIGAQNAFVLRQGLLRTHVLPLCLFCAASDAILIGLGILGFGAVSAAWPLVPRLLMLGGAAFLIAYGAMRLHAAWRGDYSLQLSGQSPSLWKTLAIAAALTWGNPHVYLDMLGLIGAISTQFPDVATKAAFGLGAATASFVFFFSLGYGARFLAPVLRTATGWRILDLIIALVMWGLAAALLHDGLA